nr:class I SAM-dependent methyltransferase [Candidatus Gracilibacteria bacterium]
MTVDYNNYAKTFSNSRKNMKWEEITYFINYLDERQKTKDKSISILDVGCGNGRLLDSLKNSSFKFSNYLGVDLSSELLNEARELHNGYEFLELDMTSLSKINKRFDIIFFIASFHHLHTFEERLDVLNNAKDLLNDNGLIFMTNWALNIGKNKGKYKDSIIKNTENKFGSYDYDIKIGKFSRFYHSFSISELEFIFEKLEFKIIENRLFDTEKNIISIIKK